MSERNNHLFQFTATEIAEAAEREAEYHNQRLKYWKAEFDKSVKRVKETASVEVTKQKVTGGWNLDVSTNYGDVSAYKRANKAARKIRKHRKARNRLESDATLYRTQGDRVYELDADDVAHFRLNGEPRDEEE